MTMDIHGRMRAEGMNAPKPLQDTIHELRAERDALRAALGNLLAKLDNLTTDEFQIGGERVEREAARAALSSARGEK